jgi:hypothetical protein
MFKRELLVRTLLTLVEIKMTMVNEEGIILTHVLD